ncbi:MAG: YqgE/AlgH family protein [Bacteroidota bacterium]
MGIKKPKKGQLLIAEPSIIGDLSFNRSVILLSHHTDSGSVGFILNKSLQVTLDELVPDVKVKFQLYNGGPVEQDNLYFIHQVPELIPESVKIKEGIYWGGSFEKIIGLINEKVITADQIKFFLGYSGWDAEQLESELDADIWIINEQVDNREVITMPAVNYWKSEIKKLGGNYLIWHNAPENPSYN